MTNNKKKLMMFLYTSSLNVSGGNSLYSSGSSVTQTGSVMIYTDS